jgi:hypothetical protein
MCDAYTFPIRSSAHASKLAFAAKQIANSLTAQTSAKQNSKNN